MIFSFSYSLQCKTHPKKLLLNFLYSLFSSFFIFKFCCSIIQLFCFFRTNVHPMKNSIFYLFYFLYIQNSISFIISIAIISFVGFDLVNEINVLGNNFFITLFYFLNPKTKKNKN